MAEPGQKEARLDALIERHISDRRFPVGADLDRDVLSELIDYADGLPGSFDSMMAYLRSRQPYAVYDIALVFASGLLRDNMPKLLEDVPLGVFDLKNVDLDKDIFARIARRYAKHPTLRDRAQRLAQRVNIEDVALPVKEGERWDYTGWRRGIEANGIFRHATGKRRQLEVGVPALENIGDIRELLNIRSQAQLGFLLLASDQSELKPYNTFHIPKKSGGARKIAAPNDQLRYVQQRILGEILEKIPVHDAAHGFVTGRSTLTNAKPHVGKDVLIKFDLKDFFNTIDYWRVVGLFASMGYDVGQLNFSSKDEDVEVAPTLARLCCYTERSSQTRRAYTPQGAPTSPAISNLICRNLDNRLYNLAKKMGGDYTRYADDLSFSFDDLPGKGVGRFRWWVNQICQQEGFVVREDKFRVIRSSQQQRVTGIVVNEGLSVPRRERRKFRAIVHNCEQHGVASQTRGREGFTDYLLGYAAYLNMVHPQEGADILRRVKALVTSQGDKDE
jgi:retron-type reverse transcriptase